MSTPSISSGARDRRKAMEETHATTIVWLAKSTNILVNDFVESPLAERREAITALMLSMEALRLEINSLNGVRFL